MKWLSGPGNQRGTGSSGKAGALAASALLVALIAVLSQVVIPLPLVPINLALLAVFLTGFVLPARYALVTVGIYLLTGALGLPVFAGLRGGPQILFGYTGGYLLGYFLSAAAVALLKGRAAGLAGRVLVCAAALLACYLPGTLWLMFLTGRPLVQVLPAAVYPFIPGDLLKCLLAAMLAPRLEGLVRL